MPPSFVARREEEVKQKRLRQRKETKGRRAREGEGEQKKSSAEHVSSSAVSRRIAENVEPSGDSTVGNVRAKSGRGGGRKKGKMTGDVIEERNTAAGQGEEDKRHSKTGRGRDSPRRGKDLVDECAGRKAGKKKKKSNDNVSDI